MSREGPDIRVHTPDDVLLRRFGLVRAVGGGAYIIAVVVLLAILGWRVWPLAFGVPILGVVTTWYFVSSDRYPRTAVIVSLIADTVVLGGAVAYMGGSGSGLVMLYAIPVVSAGILLGPSAAMGFTGLGVALGALQLLLEEAGLPPAVLHRQALDERVPILLASLAGLASVGYLSGTYAERLHALIASAGHSAEALRKRGETRRSFVQHALGAVREPLAELGAITRALEEPTLAPEQRRALAARLRVTATRLDAEVDQLVDLGIMDAAEVKRPEPLRLQRVVEDCVAALGERLESYTVSSDIPPVKILGDPRAARRVVYNLLENVVEHTPAGTAVRLTALTTAGHGVLVVTDDGPGIPPQQAATLFDPPESERGEERTPAVGLPLVRELCRAMGADVRSEPAPTGGARFIVAFRLAPTSAPSADDERPPSRGAAGGGSTA